MAQALEGIEGILLECVRFCGRLSGVVPPYWIGAGGGMEAGRGSRVPSPSPSVILDLVLIRFDVYLHIGVAHV